MEQELKQRLVGAIVITALAAIFVPMLFDDPVDETGKKINELEIPSLPERLEKNQSIKVPESLEEVTELPLEQPLATIEPDSKPEAVEKPVANASPAPSARSASSGRAAELQYFYLQVGLFSQEENALALRDKLRQQGYSAAVSQVKGDAGDMFKVKVGPEMNRERAEKVKSRLKAKQQLDSFVIQE